MSSPRKSVFVFLLLTFLAACDGAENRTPAGYIAAAQGYIDDDKHTSALIELKNALRQAPDNALARRLLGETYLAMGDGPSAQKELEQAASLGVDPGFIQPLLARALLLQQDYDGVLKINPYQAQLLPAGKASVHAARGMAQLAGDKLDEADKEFAQGQAEDADSLEVLTGQAWLATARQDLDQARLQLDKVFAINADYAEAWSLLGNIERSQGKLEAALAAYSKAAANRVANTWDILNQISINIALDRLDQAKTDIAAQRNRGAGNYLLDYLEGLLAYQQKRYAEAHPLFSRALQANPDHVRSLYYNGASLLVTGNLEQARGHLLRFDAKNPGYAPALKMLAWIAMKNENYADVQRYIRPVLAQAPDDVFSLNLLSSALIGDNKTAEGLEILQQVTTLQPDSADARMKLGVSMIMEGKLESGLDELQASRELDPGVQQTSLAIIFTYLRTNEPDKALEAALSLRTAHPDSVVANAALGTVYLSRQEPEAATLAFRDTLALDSDNMTANSGLASLAVQAGKPGEAKSYYRKILEKHPDNLSTSMNLAYLSALDGSVDEMQAVLEKAIEANPGAPLPRLALARYYTEQADHAKVIDILAPVRQSARGDFTYLKMLSEAQYRSGDYVNVRNTLKALIDVAPNNASAHYLLAVTSMKLGNNEGVRDELKQVLTLEPTHLGARILSIQLMIADGDTPAAHRNIDLLRKQTGDTAEVFLLEGRLASSTGDHTAAVAAYRRAFEMKETNINLLKLENATWESGDRDAAVGLLTAWLEKLPADQASSVRLASRYVAMGREADAITVYRGMLKQTPDNVIALNDLAWLLRDSEPKQALAYAEKAHSLAPKSHAVTDTLAVVASKSDPKRAQLLIREALRASPGNPGYRYHQALILKRLGENKKALQVVKELLQESSDFPAASDAKLLLKELGG